MIHISIERATPSPISRGYSFSRIAAIRCLRLGLKLRFLPQVPDPASQRGARVDGVPDGPRAAPDAGADRGASVPRAVRAHTVVHAAARADAARAAARAALLRVRVRCVRARVPRVPRLRDVRGLLPVLPPAPVPGVTAIRDGSVPNVYSVGSRPRPPREPLAAGGIE